MVLNILRCTGLSLTTQNDLVSSVNSLEVEKAWSKSEFIGFILSQSLCVLGDNWAIFIPSEFPG